MVDDIIVWWVAPDEFLVMPNASNTDRITGALAEVAAGGRARRRRDHRHHRDPCGAGGAGPDGPRACSRPSIRRSPRSSGSAVASVRWEDVACVVAGTGYTGEDGVEIHVPAADAPRLWRAIVAAGVTPAGLGARDTLRLEAGLPLHGHELGEGITPLQAGLGWVVRWDKGDFRGRDALAAERDRGVARRLRGLLVDGRRPPRAHNPVVVDGVAVGEVTSGNFSPMLGRAIALAFLPPETRRRRRGRASTSGATS